MNNGHYICNSLINDTWYEINDDQYKLCSKPCESTTCSITLWKLIENDLNTNDNNISNNLKMHHNNNNDNNSTMLNKRH